MSGEFGSRSHEARSDGGSGAAPLAPAAQIGLSALSAAAGIIHLAMVPSHWSESVVEGLGFAATGWFQVGIAVALLLRPHLMLLRVAIVANVAFLCVWAISRTWGLPFGEHGGHPHDAGFVDLVCVGIEVTFVIGAVYVLWHPTVGRSWHGARLAMLAVVPLAVIALATAALASPSARDPRQ